MIEPPLPNTTGLSIDTEALPRLPLRQPTETRSRSHSQTPGVQESPVRAQEGNNAEGNTREGANMADGANTGERADTAGGANIVEDTVDIAAKLAEQLVQFHGCKSRQHRRQAREHQVVSAEHISLEDFTTRHGSLPDTLNCPDMLAQDRISAAEAEQWKHAFLGTTPQNPDRPAEVCIHCSHQEQPSVLPTVEYDIDSIMGFARSLAVAKQGIRLNLTPQVVSNLATNIHLTFPVAGQPGQTQQVPLHTIPHYLLGRLIGYDDISIFLFFPRLYKQGRANNYLSQAVLQRWTDRVLLPAIYSQASASTLQHYPGSYKHSKQSSKAAHTESHTRIDKTGSRHQYIHHFLYAEILKEVWDTVTSTVEEDGLQDLQDVTIFFTGKNLKALTKRQRLHNVWHDFFLRWDQAINSSYIYPDKAWLDLGKEVCAPPSFLWYQDAGNQLAMTYIWRPCCLNSYWEWSQHGYPLKKSLRKVYNTALLRDAVGMTILTPCRSPSRQQGLLYSQFYNSTKEITDAAKKFPFNDMALESLALDPNIRASWQHTGGSENHRTDTLTKSYLGSKERCSEGFAVSVQKSFGTREEHRMTWALAGRVKDHLEAMGVWDREIVPTGPSPFWCLPTATFLGFTSANINKFTSGFEYVRSLSIHDFVSWEHSQAMIAFLRLLKFGYGSHDIKREIALWWDEKRTRTTGKQVYGLGFSSTIQQYGYGWFLPKIDWERFTFLEELGGRSLFGNIHMADAFKARWRAIQEMKDDFIKVDTLGRWLRQYKSSLCVSELIIQHMRWICVRHFRKDVLSSIKESIRAEYRTEAITGGFTLCRVNLDRILVPEKGQEVPQYRLASGNKMAYKNLVDFVNFLWDFNDGQERKHWEKKGYRVLYERCVQIIESCYGIRRAARFSSDVKGMFPLINWIVPYPNHTVFWQHTKQHERMWLSIYSGDLDSTVEVGGRLGWKAIRERQKGNSWKIGRTKLEVMQAIPVEPQGISNVGMDDIKARVLKLWESSELSESSDDDVEVLKQVC